MALKRVASKKASRIKDRIASCVAGKIIPAHTDEGHYYLFPSGKVQTSVTGKISILNKPHLTRWIVKKGIEFLEEEGHWDLLKDPTLRQDMINKTFSAHTLIRDDAGHVGSMAHQAIEDYVKAWIATGTRPEDIKTFLAENTDPRAIAAARAIEKLFIKEEIVPLASEILVGQEGVSAGTLDFLCLAKGQLELWDFKTSNSVSDDYALQTSAYKKFFEHMTKLRIKKVRIIKLSKDNDTYTIYRVTDPRGAYRVFRAVALTHDWLMSPESKLEKDINKIKLWPLLMKTSSPITLN